MAARRAWFLIVVAALLGVAGGAAAGWLVWGRRAGAAAARLAALESSALQLQTERQRLRHELGDIVRERREMAATAEHLRVQVDRQLERLEKLSAELAPSPEDEAESPAESGSESAPPLEPPLP